MLITGAAALRRLGGDVVLEHPEWDYHLIIDCVGGPTFGRWIDHVAPRGVVANIATQQGPDMVTF